MKPRTVIPRTVETSDGPLTLTPGPRLVLLTVAGKEIALTPRQARELQQALFSTMIDVDFAAGRKDPHND